MGDDDFLGNLEWGYTIRFKRFPRGILNFLRNFTRVGVGTRFCIQSSAYPDKVGIDVVRVSHPKLEEESHTCRGICVRKNMNLY